jgi:hypothetical protein
MIFDVNGREKERKKEKEKRTMIRRSLRSFFQQCALKSYALNETMSVRVFFAHS